MPTLDQGPPPPPGITGGQPAPKPSMQGLAGQPPQGAPQPSGVQQAVLEKMMLAEKAMQDAATLMPALAPVIEDLTQQFRARVGAVVLNQQQGADQPPTGLSALLGGSGQSAPATA